MESQSIFQEIRSRELNGWRVKKRPFLTVESNNVHQVTSEAVAIGHDGEEIPPLAVSFCKTAMNAHWLAVSDEQGYVSLFNTRTTPSSADTLQGSTDRAQVSNWCAHNNAVFDICWIKDDCNILTASGDQTIKVWDAQQQKCIGTLTGHYGSVKSLSSHPINPDIVASASRDGSFALWDLRCSSRDGKKICSTARISGAHSSTKGKRARRGKATSMSITSVLYLYDEVSVATAGAVDSTIKFWDTRKLKSHFTQACPHGPENELGERSYGVTSLSQDSKGVLLSASCFDDRIYLYNVLQLEKGPISSFTGCSIDSFFVKSAISPDGSHILSGSSDGNAYIWQVDKPEKGPLTLESHDGEVTAVDWCQHELEKITTASDDCTVRFWDLQSNLLPSSRPCTRRRVMGLRRADTKYITGNFLDTSSTGSPKRAASLMRVFRDLDEPELVPIPDINTPESNKNKQSALNIVEDTERTPKAAMKSPSSVLHPPSSTKRKTIRDYFA